MTGCSACTSPDPSATPGQFAESWVDLLFVKGFDAGQPIVYISTDAGQPLTAVLERSTYVPALDRAAYNGGDDFLGSARERLFGFINGQTGADNKQAQGFVHLVRDGHASEDASAGNTALIDALRNGGDLLNVFGDFPTLTDPRHAQAYSPLWDAQLGLWTEKAIKQGLNTRQIDEVQVFNLAATRPDLLTGYDAATNSPAPYGSVGVDINCGVIGFTAKAAHRQPRHTRAQLPIPTPMNRDSVQRRTPTGPPLTTYRPPRMTNPVQRGPSRRTARCDTPPHEDQAVQTITWIGVRVARPTRDLDSSVMFYGDLLGLPRTGGFRDHDGYDGVFFALPAANSNSPPVPRSPTAAPPRTCWCCTSTAWTRSRHWPKACWPAACSP